MYLFKNAFRNVIRSKGRNLLIGLIVLIISFAACISLSIREAAKTAEEDGMENVEITGQITVDRQSMMEDMQESGSDRSAMKEKMSELSELSVSDLQKYAKSSAVKNFYYTLTASFDGNNIEEVSTSSDSSSDSTSDSSSDSNMPENGTKGGMMSQGAFSLVGYSSEDAMTEFVSGTCKITDGEMFEEGTTDQTCVISDELATYNSLKVGDTIKLENPSDTSETISLKVVGIYNNSSSTTSQSGVMGGFNGGSDPANQIYLSYNALKALTKDLTDMRAQTNGTYVFSDLDAYEQFKDDVEDMGLDDTYTVTSQDVNNYESSLVPLQNLSKFATYAFIIVLAIGAVILMVIHIFNIRERKYEIGVLTAIGMKKGKVCMQFVIELFLVTIFAMIIGLAAGSVASKPVSNQLLATQIESQQEEAQNQESNFGRGGGPGGNQSDSQSTFNNKGMVQSATNYVSSISASVNGTIILQMFALGILLTILSSIIAVAFIVRYEPLKILSNRS